MSVNVWHKIEAFFKMNTISGSVGQPDGIIRHWLDGVLQIEHTDVIMRTNENATMQWEQLILAPYIGDGSPITQTMWVDELTVGTENPNASGAIPNAPSSISVD